MNRTPQDTLTVANVDLITYRPRWVRDAKIDGLYPDAYRAGFGTEIQRVAYADQQAGYHDWRVALNLRDGYPIEAIHPVTGTCDRSQPPALFEVTA